MFFRKSNHKNQTPPTTPPTSYTNFSPEELTKTLSPIRTALLENDFPLAEQHLISALQQYPNHPDILTLYIIFNLKQYRIKDAQHLLDHHPHRDPITNHLHQLVQCLTTQLSATHLDLQTSTQPQSDFETQLHALLDAQLGDTQQALNQLQSITQPTPDILRCIAILQPSEENLIALSQSLEDSKLNHLTHYAITDQPNPSPQSDPKDIRTLATELAANPQLILSLVYTQQLNPNPIHIALLRLAIKQAAPAITKLPVVIEALAKLALLAQDHTDAKAHIDHGLKLYPYSSIFAQLAYELSQQTFDQDITTQANHALKQATYKYPHYTDLQQALENTPNQSAA